MKHGIDISDLKKSKSKLTPIQDCILENYNIRIEDQENYFNKNIDSLHSPFLLPDFAESILLLDSMIQNGKKILLYGDKDTDGISSISILAIFLKQKHSGILTVKNSTDGDDYGLCPKVVKFILNEKPDLLITLDFGTSNFDEINLLSKENIDIIVVDHHEIPKKIPNCKLINPKREDSIYPEQKICTAALASKLILGYLILEKVKIENIESTLFPNYKSILEKISINDYFKKYPDVLEEFTKYLSLSAIGTITDMMPLTGENRIIVEEGLKSLKKILETDELKFIGLKTLLSDSKLNPLRITSKDLGWTIGPVLNAAGRMGKTDIATKLLLSTSYDEASKNSKLINDLNFERKERTKRNLYKVEEYFKRKKERIERKIIFCYEPDLESGVSGIIATKLVEIYKRPAIFINPEHGIAKGSIRSYANENVLELLEKVSHLLNHYGGHKEAGGFTIELKNIPIFESEIEIVAEEWLKTSNQNIQIDSSVFSISPSELVPDIYKQIQIFQPFGMENPEPIISIRNAKIINFKPMSENKHARFHILGASPKINFIIWNKAIELENLLSNNSEIQIFGFLEENFFKAATSIQFVVKHFGL